MRRFLALVVITSAPTLEAQVPNPRSATYLFSADVNDARALWINPAGLGVVPIASLYGELTTDRLTSNADWNIRQYSFGLHSRSFAIGYQKDRLATGGSQGLWRAGAAFPLGRRLAIGTATSFTSPERGIDLGLRLAPAKMLDVGVVLRNIGRPNVRGTKQPLSAIGGMAWRLAGGRLGIQADATGTEGETGWGRQYRAGGVILIPGRTPFTFLTALDLGDNMRIDRWSIGIGIGFAAQLLGVGTAVPQSGNSGLQTFSLTGLARARTRR